DLGGRSALREGAENDYAARAQRAEARRCDGGPRPRVTHYFTVTRANLRLPACTTTVAPGATTSDLSSTTSPSILSPRCAMSRSASDVDSTIPACLATCAISRPALLPCSVTSGM